VLGGLAGLVPVRPRGGASARGAGDGGLAVCGGAALAGVAFDPVHEVDCIEIAERVTGTSATDFGALDVAPVLDGEPGTAQQAERQAALVETSGGRPPGQHQRGSGAACRRG